MSGIEIVGIAASVLQLADVGARLSVKLFAFSRKVKNAKRAISQLSQEIASTGAALHEVADVLEDSEVANIVSQNAIATTKQVVADCWRVFKSIAETMGVTVIKGDDQEITIEVPASFSFRRRFKFPFVEPDVALLMVKLESLKSSLMLMLQILSVALQVKRQPTYVIPYDQQALIQTLLAERKAHDAKFSRMMRRLGTGNGDGDDDEDEDTEPTPRPQGIALTTSFPAKPATSLRSSSDSSATPTSSGETDSEDELPPRIRIRAQEIKHHALLTQNLVKEVSKARYEVGHGIRHNMEHAILDAHYEEWLKLAQRYTHDVFLYLFQERTPVYRYWMDKYHSELDISYTSDVEGSNDGVRKSESTSHDVPGAPPDTVPLSEPTRDTQQGESPHAMQFKDAIGRKYRIPWDVARDWTQVQPLITKMFAYIVDLGEHVAEMRYDLVESDGNLIMPDLWDATVEPGMSVTMMLWPLPEPTSNDQQQQVPAQAVHTATEEPLPPLPPLPDLDSLLSGSKKKILKGKGKKPTGSAFPNWMMGGEPGGTSHPKDSKRKYPKDGKEQLPKNAEKETQKVLSELLLKWTTSQGEEVDKAVGKGGVAAGGDGDTKDDAGIENAASSGQTENQDKDEDEEG